MAYEKILLIDDDEDDQEIFLTALERVSDTVTCTAIGNARNALQQLEEKKLLADIIFLDLNMPVMNGQQFLSAIKKNSQLDQIPVIIFSTTSHPDTITLVKEMGADDFITKPDKFDELVGMLKSFIH